MNASRILRITSVRRLAGLSLALACAATLRADASRPACHDVSPHRLASVSAYVASRYELPADLTVEDEGLAGESCFRRLLFTSSSPKKSLTLYLSPDGRHLTSDLMDTTRDPAVLREQQARITAQALSRDPSPSKGPRDAKVTLVAFSDYQCPFCKRFHDLLGEASREWPGAVRVVFKQFPLGMHNWARPAARAAACAGLQSDSLFWNLSDYFFANQAVVTPENIATRTSEWAPSAEGLDRQRFDACLAGKEPDEILRRDLRLVQEFQIQGTPTVFVNGRRRQFRSSDELRIAIDQALGAGPVTSSLP
jgi:protein-disulfide isomerase